MKVRRKRDLADEEYLDDREKKRHKKKKHKKKFKHKKRKKSENSASDSDDNIAVAWRERLFGEMEDDDPFIGWLDDREDEEEDWFEDVAKRMHRKRLVEDYAERIRHHCQNHVKPSPPPPPGRPPTPTFTSHEEEEPTHYERLGVARNATPAQIRLAYLSLAKQLHPDKQNANQFSSDRMAKLNHARDVLTDPISRQNYDRSLLL
uniref:J domain-containing protein n=1 Tax=Aureoumbra lagunensis TaxID=44058 RepID=A0A7S3JW86_9STRA|mmetsp:Transcript_706/g.891  ORF Transcript_706/g.891 Transcript_706/m.891 type:complete len:205 (-) Transcript_706:76-690(-)